MEAVNVQRTSTAGMKSPHLTPVARLLPQGDIGESSTSCDFQSCGQEQDNRTVPNTLDGSNTNGRQQHHAVEVGGHLCLTTRFEQQAEQLLQQDQALQMDQILDLLGLLLKQQQPSTEKELSLMSSLQQGATSSTVAGTSEAQRQPQAASLSSSARERADAATPHWVNTEKLSGGTADVCGPVDTLTGSAAALELLPRSRRGSIISALKNSDQHQQEKELPKLHRASIAAAATADDGSHISKPPFKMLDCKSSSRSCGGKKQHQKNQLDEVNLSDWSNNCAQPPSSGMMPAVAAEAAAEPTAFREAGGDSVYCCNYNSSGSARKGEQQRLKNGSSSPAGIPFRVAADVAHRLANSSEERACVRDGRQLPQMLQVRHQPTQQQRYQQNSAEQPQLQLVEHMSTQEYLMKQHGLLYPPHLQPLPQSGASGRSLSLELRQQRNNLADLQLQRVDVEESISNEETSHILSESLDVLMEDVNIQALKDLLMRKTSHNVVGSGSSRDCQDAVETCYGSQTHVTRGDVSNFDAALLSLLQQQHQPRQQQQDSQQQSRYEGEGMLDKNLSTDLKSAQRVTQGKEQHRRGGKEGDASPPTSPQPPVPPAFITTRGRSCSARSAEEELRITQTGQRQQETGAESPTHDAARFSTHFERTSSGQSERSPAQKVKSEGGLSFKRGAAAEGAIAAGASGNKRGNASQRQQQQHAEKRQGHFARSFSPDQREHDTQYMQTSLASGDPDGGSTSYAAFDSDNAVTARGKHESYKEVGRRARYCAPAAARDGSLIEASPSDDSPPAAELTGVSFPDKNLRTTGRAALAEAVDREYERGGHRNNREERQKAFGVSQAHRQCAETTASRSRLQEKRGTESICGNSIIAEQSSTDTFTTSAEKRVEAEDLSDTNKQPGASTPTTRQPACEVVSGVAGTVRTRLSSTLRSYRSSRRCLQEPCELALAAARLEQQGHTFTPPFYLRTPAVATNNGGSRCGSTRGENSKRGEAVTGAEKSEKVHYHDGDTSTGGKGGRSGPISQDHSQDWTASQKAEEEQKEVNMEDEDEDEDSENDVLTQQQLTLLKHIYAVLSQAEEYFSFKSALYQLQIKRHLKKCVSSLAAAAATNGAGSDKDSSPNTATGGNKLPRFLVHASNSPSKAIRCFTSMPPIPINVVEQRALLNVRKHLQAGGGGALLCQADGFAQLLMEELDELLTSLVNKLLLIIVVKFQTCFIHAPARAQLREFLVSFVFPGDMATQLLFRDHVQAVVHARIRHFRDSVGRTLRHQPPPSPPLTAASLPRGGTKRSSRAVGGCASSPTSRDTEEEGDDEEERQKKLKVCEVVPDFERRDIYYRTAAAPPGRSPSGSDRRRLSPTSAAHTTTMTQPSGSAYESASHSTTSHAAMQPGKGHGRQSNTLNSHDRIISAVSRSPKSRGAHRERTLSNISDAKQVVQYNTSESVRGSTIGREGCRNSRIVEQGSVAAAAESPTADSFAGPQKKGTHGGAGRATYTNGGETEIIGRTRGRLNSRRRRGTVAANTVAELSCPSASCSRSGPAAATRRGGNAPATDKSSNGSAYPQEEAAGHQQQQCVREAGSIHRRGAVAMASGARRTSKGASDAFISEHRCQRDASGSAGEDRGPNAYSGDGQKPEGHRRIKETRSGALEDLHLGRTSAAITQSHKISDVEAGPDPQSPQQQENCSPGKHGDLGSCWRSATFFDEKAQKCDKGHDGSGDVAEESVDTTESRNSILSRGSTRESAGDPLAWDQADALHSKSFANPRILLSSQVHVPRAKVVRTDSLDANRADGKTSRGAAGEKTSPGEIPGWTTTRSEGDEATQALAAALGGALDSNSGDSAAAAAGDVWEWLAVAAGSKDEQQHEKFKKTLETLLNAWSATGSNDGRHLRGMHNSDMTTDDDQDKLRPASGSNNVSEWVDFGGEVFPGAQGKKPCVSQVSEVNFNPFDIAGDTMHFSNGGIRGKGGVLPSPPSLKGPPSEASTSLPPHEERTPPAERSTPASADPDATHSLRTTEKSTSRRGSTLCLPDISLGTGSTTVAEERGISAICGTASVSGQTEGVVGSFRTTVSREANKTHERAACQRETPVFDNIPHSTIADLLLTYCKDDVSAYEIAEQLRHRETTTSAAALAATSMAPGTSHDGVQGAEAYMESAMAEEKLMSSFTLSQAEQTTKNTANNIELPTLLAEALSASHIGGNSLALSLSSLLASSNLLPS